MRAVLLDTNAYVRFMAGDERVLACLAQAGRVYMSVFVLGELAPGSGPGRRKSRTDRSSTASWLSLASWFSIRRGKPPSTLV